MSKTDNKVTGYSSGAAIAEQLNKVTDLEREKNYAIDLARFNS